MVSIQFISNASSGVSGNIQTSPRDALKQIKRRNIRKTGFVVNDILISGIAALGIPVSNFINRARESTKLEKYRRKRKLFR
jgi:hypothetical protein